MTGLGGGGCLPLEKIPRAKIKVALTSLILFESLKIHGRAPDLITGLETRHLLPLISYIHTLN